MRLLSLLAVVLVAASMLAQNADFPKKTYVFKTVGDVPIHADVYRPADDKVRPVVVWLHGGALINGSRSSVPKQIYDQCRKEGYVLVSFDYRLGPETKLPGIIADVEDGFRWLREKGPGLFHVDPDRLVVTGGSAGGYLTLMTGIRVKPRPTALVAYWGYGDVDGDWYTQPSEFYRKQPLVPKEEAYQGVGKGVVTESDAKTGRPRGRFYLYCRQNGLWTKEVTGFDPVKDRARLDPYCPVRNVTAEYPPTLLIHGTVDTDVPYELSANMAKEFVRHKIAHELITLEGAGHGLSGGNPSDIARAHERAARFIREHLKK